MAYDYDKEDYLATQRAYKDRTGTNADQTPAKVVDKNDYKAYLKERGLDKPRIYDPLKDPDPLPPAAPIQLQDGDLSTLTANEITNPETPILRQLDMFDP